MKLTKVESSNIAAIGYSKAKKTLRIEFLSHKTGKSNPVYDYHPISPETHAALMAAESHGKYFSANIRNADGITSTKI